MNLVRYFLFNAQSTTKVIPAGKDPVVHVKSSMDYRNTKESATTTVVHHKHEGHKILLHKE